jgi:putative DNA primase/helicase
VTRGALAISNQFAQPGQYAARGWPILPLHTVRDRSCSCTDGPNCAHPGKHPRTPHGVKDATTRKTQIREWREKWPDANIGIATGGCSGIFVLDIDGEIGKASLRDLKVQHGPLPKTLTVKTGKGRHYYFRCEGARVPNRVGHPGDGIDVRGDGGYVVAAGSVHVSGSRYRFVDGRGLDDIEVARAPAWLHALVTAEPATKPKNELPSVILIPAAKLDRARAYAEAARQQEVGRVRKAPGHQRNNSLNVAAFKLGQFLPYGLLKEVDVVDDLAKAAAEIGLDEREIRPTIDSGLNAGRKNPRGLPFVKEHSSLTTVEPTTSSDNQITGQLATLGETDTDNAQRFAERFGMKVVHTPGRGWLVFDGRRWRSDTLLRVNELAKETARLISSEAAYLSSDSARAARSRFAQQTLAKGALDRMLDLARSLLAVEDTKLDADPWLLNVENGTINLRTGRREKHDPRDLLTMIAPVRANRGPSAPISRNSCVVSPVTRLASGASSKRRSAIRSPASRPSKCCSLCTVRAATTASRPL